MTAVENTERTEDADEATPAPEAVKNPTYFELVKATWLLAYDLSSWGERELFCVDGTNEWLRALGLPELVEIDGDRTAESYVTAWFNWQNWTCSGELSVEDDARLHADLATRLRRKLEREEPKSRGVMSGWLAQLGLEPFDPPAPPPQRRHVGRYDVEYNESNQVTSARIQEALRAVLDNLDVQVTYVGRIA